jgi:hypothetical protein
MRKPKAPTPARRSKAARAAANALPPPDLICCDEWTQPLTAAQVGGGSFPPSTGIGLPTTWLSPPNEPGCAEVVALWVQRAIASEPLVQEWHRHHGVRVLANCGGVAPSSDESLAALIEEEFQAEGGAAALDEVTEKVAKAFARDAADGRRRRKITQRLPDSSRIAAVVSEVVVRSPVVTISCSVGDSVVSRSVLRDGRLGQLAVVADLLADRYLVPASEIVYCILTGQAPTLAAVRVGLRFRGFRVEGVPVTATSRVVLDVDPQLEPAELLRVFVEWQRASGVRPAKPSSKLVPLATALLGRLNVVSADPESAAGSHSGEFVEAAGRMWSLVPAVPWIRLAREINYDPHLIRGRAGAVVRLLRPLDAPRSPRWLPGDRPHLGGGPRPAQRRPSVGVG